MEEYQSKLFDYKELESFNWSAYNNSQAKEGLLFKMMLKELCGLLETENDRLCKRPLPLSHRIFCMCLKVYLGKSSRRTQSSLEECRNMGYIHLCPHYNSVLNYFNDPSLKLILKYLIEVSAIPLVQTEKKFAVDATGFSLPNQEKWSSARSKYSKHKMYKKAHIIYGVESNIVTSCKITEGTSNDSPHYKELLEATAKNFKMEEVSADKAYSSRDNLKFTSKYGAIPFIPFKTNANGNAKGCTIWTQMFKFFLDYPEEFGKKYHLRNNAETGMAMIKKKFDGFVRCKGDISQTNEILCKILCHNICVNIQEIFLQKLEVNFLECSEKYVAQKRVMN